MGVIKNLANIITGLRIVFSIAMLIFNVDVAAFWCFYFAAGLSDMADGFTARKMGAASEFGAKLDSIADYVFTVFAAIKLLLIIEFSVIKILLIAAIAAVKIVSLIVGRVRFGEVVMLHTYANKFTGLIIFIGMFCLCRLKFAPSLYIMCAVAALAAAEELIIVISSKCINRNIKSAAFAVRNMSDKK